VLTGDVHSSWVGSLATDFDDPASDRIGTEFVGPGISSAAPDLLASIVDPVLALSPHLDWAEVGHRGWVLHEITPDEWRTTYRFVDDPTVEGGTVSDGARFVVRPGQAVEAA
jgi:alkaline phosphatase D